MHAVFGFLIRVTSPLWRVIGAHPWLSAATLAAASALCFALEIPYLRAALGAAAGAVLIAKSEADRRREITLAATPARLATG